MKKINVLNIFKSTKEKLKFELKYTFFSKFLPFIGVIGLTYYIYKYKLYQFKEYVFTLSEEKLISKKIYPLIRYKYIEKLYDEDMKEYIIVSKLYEGIIKHLKMNIKSEVSLVKSDLIFLYILPTGNLIVSDVI